MIMYAFRAYAMLPDPISGNKLVPVHG